MIEIQKILELDPLQIVWLLLLFSIVIALYYYYFKYRNLKAKAESLLLEMEYLRVSNAEMTNLQSDYKRVVERSNDGIVICVDNQIVFVNDSAASILERSKISCLDKNLQDFISERASSEFIDINESVLKDIDSSAFIETEFDLGWGDIKFIEMSLTHILYKNKGAILSIFRDVTLRKRTEKKLKENEILYRSLFEHAGDAIFIMDGNQFVDCNQRTLEIFACSKQQILKQEPYKLSPERQSDGELSKAMAIKKIRAAKEGIKQHFQWQHKRFNGEIFEAEVSLSLLPLEDKSYILAIVRDIDEKARYKLEIEASNQFLAQLLNAIPSPVAQIGPSAEVTLANLQFDTIFSLFDKNGNKFYKLPDNMKEHIFALSNSAHNKEIRVFEINLMSEIYKIYIRPVYKNSQISYILVMFNITEQCNKQTELENLIEELNQARNDIAYEATKTLELNDKLLQSEQRLTQMNSVKDKFFSIIAHDLKNPLSVFHGITSFLKFRLDELSQEEISDSIDDLYSSAEKLLSLLDNLLDWARSQTGRMEFNPELVDLYEITLTIEYLFKENAKKKGLTIKNEITPEFYISADRNMLSTIIRNLVSNSIKFTDSGGFVSVSALKNKNELVIFVADTGIGMEESIKNKLFDLGQKISTKGTRAESGTGIGLVMVKEFIDRHNGTIEVESSIGKGTTFKIVIPQV